ncbi:hypothetical protein [Streptomyces sp. NPDC058304]|uniref:hypothetical protein n=1 Tax=Streptomyces sp. NPDC058304 TaxID=3346437 RepID=UPI0036EDA74F
MEQETESAGRGDAERSVHRSTALAALGGALIGALSGLLGSGLVYVQGEKTQNTTASARRADIRRTAYVEYAASCHAFETAIIRLAPMVGADSDQNERRREVQEGFIPVVDRMNRAGMTVRLVGSDRSRTLFTEVEQGWRGVTYKVSDAYGKPVPDLKKFIIEITEDLKDFQRALNEFLDEVDGEVL